MKIIFTSAIINNYYDFRKLEYLESYNTLLNFVNKKDIFIVECFLHQKSFFDEYQNVFYSKSHNEKIRNKGVREAMGLIKFIESNREINDNDIVIKHTGRYKFLSKFLLDDIEKNQDKDLFVRENTNQYFTGTFGMRYKYFKQFLLNLNLNQMEKNMINIEKKIYDFSIQENLNKKTYSNIDIYSNINNQQKYFW